ncbi:MAG: hypothetical protein AB7G93_05270 [Bdellovibrionales bacterium]
MVLILFAPAPASSVAEDVQREKSAFEQALEQDTQISTREQWIEINGTRYRQVEYEGVNYYLKFSDRRSDVARLDCELSNANAQPHRVEAGVRVYKRTRAFVSLLRETCSAKNGQNKMDLVLDPRIGFTLPEDEKSAIKNKKIYISPVPGQGLGFSGEW